MADEQKAGQAQPTPNAGGEGEKPAGTNAPADKTFTQAELDAILGERLKREREKFTDYDDLKKFKQTQEEASKSELEKLTDAKVKAEQSAKDAQANATAKILNAEARALAAELKFKKPAVAVKLIDLAKAQVGEDGAVSGVREMLESLAKEMPELLDAPMMRASDATNPGKGASGESDGAKLAKRALGRGDAGAWLAGGRLVINSSE